MNPPIKHIWFDFSETLTMLKRERHYWSEQINSLDPTELYALSDPDIPVVLPEIRKHVPISIFSNIHVQKILTALAIDPSWFTHIIEAGMVKEPKPALEGFYKMIEISGLPPENILYIGDHLGKDIRPAKKVGIQAGLMWKESDETDYCFKKFQDVLDLLKTE